MSSRKTRLLFPLLIIFMLIYGGLLQADSVSPRGYLPLVVGGKGAATAEPTAAGPTITPSSTPGSTPTSTPTDTPGTIAIVNGDFESGRSAWTESSQWENILIVRAEDLPRGITPHSGRWAAWLGGDNDELAAIEQAIVVAPQAATLVYWYWIDWPFACQGDTAALVSVSLDQTVLWQSDVCQETDTGGWVRQSLDLGPYAGAAATLRFQLSTATNSFANFYLDDVSLQAIP